MLTELQKNLKNWIANGMLDEVFDALMTHIAVTAAVYNKFINLKAEFKALEDEENLRLEERSKMKITRNQINNSLLKLIDDIQESDLADEQPSLIPIHYYHQYTCDRVEQSDCFREFYNQKKEKKLHYYYIYGLDVQSHRGLFRRLSYGLEGRLEDYLNPELETSITSLKIDLTFETSNNLDFYKENVLKSFFAGCNIPVNEQEPLLEKTLVDTLAQSPSLKGLTSEDFVSVFMGISEWDWDIEVTPQIVKWFIYTFCGDNLPATAPTFIFFFGIIYEEDDSEVEEEIRTVIDKSTTIEALPELNMVELRDIKKWFAKYKNLTASARERKELIAQHFGHAKEFEMEEVEIKLQQIIDEYNA